MNLSELRNKIKTITDYQPELMSYNKQLDSLINDAYQYIWSAKPWLFTQKTSFLNFYRDILPADLTLHSQGDPGTQTCNVTDSSRQVTFNADCNLFLHEPHVWEGQIFECQGRDYKILKVIDETEIRLEEPFRGTTSVTDDSWRVKHRYYNLPDDAIEILSLSHRDAPVPGAAMRGKLIALSPRQEEDFNFDVDRASSSAEFYVVVPPVFIPPAEKLTATVLVSLVDPAGIKGDLPDSTYYELCWAFETDGGLVGPLSESLVVNVPATGEGDVEDANGIRLTFTTHDDQTIGASTFDEDVDIFKNPYEGLRKRIYYNQNFNRTTGERLGLPLWREVSASTVGSDQFAHLPLRADDEDTTCDVGWLGSMSGGNARYVQSDGMHYKIRPFPRINSTDFEYDYAVTGEVQSYEQFFMQGELRYRRQPLLLCSTTDTPEIPYEMHMLIVYKALEDVFVKSNNSSMADQYRRKLERDLKAYEVRYCQRKDTLTQRQGWHLGSYMSPLDGRTLRKVN